MEMKKHAAIFWERLAELDASDYKPYLPSQNELRRPPTVEINKQHKLLDVQYPHGKASKGRHQG